MGRVVSPGSDSKGLTMTDPLPIDADAQPPHKRFTPTESADILVMYLIRRRETLIIELRELDRLLGRPQTVPERTR